MTSDARGHAAALGTMPDLLVSSGSQFPSFLVTTHPPLEGRGRCIQFHIAFDPPCRNAADADCLGPLSDLGGLP